MLSFLSLGNLLRGKNSIDSPQNSPHRCCCSVTHTDGAAPFSSFSVLTCTLVMFSEPFPWAFSLTQWGKFTPQRGCSSASVHPGRYFCVDYIWWTSAKSSLESLSLKSCCLKTKHTAQNLLQFFVSPFPHRPQLCLSCEQEDWVAWTERCLKCSVLHPPESPLALGFFSEHFFSLLYFQTKYGLTLYPY